MRLNVLFVGNSHTYLHYMPQILSELVKADYRGVDLNIAQSTGNGVSLEWHWNHDPTRQKIRNKRWNYVILQDRSGGPLEELESFQTHARQLDREVKTHGAKTIFYMTWAIRSRPQTQSMLADAYSRMARELRAILAPVGLAWQNAQNADPELNLYHEDGRHANPTGAYLTACVFYAVLFNISPEGLPATFFIEGKKRPDQEEAQALLLQKVAWDTVSNKRS